MSGFDEPGRAPIPFVRRGYTWLKPQDYMGFWFKGLVEDRYPTTSARLAPGREAHRRHRFVLEASDLKQVTHGAAAIERPVPRCWREAVRSAPDVFGFGPDRAKPIRLSDHPGDTFVRRGDLAARAGFDRADRRPFRRVG